MNVLNAKSRARMDDEVTLEILYLRDATDLSALEIGQRVGRSRSAVLGIEKRIRDAGVQTCLCQHPENKDGGMPGRWWAK